MTPPVAAGVGEVPAASALQGQKRAPGLRAVVPDFDGQVLDSSKSGSHYAFAEFGVVATRQVLTKRAHRLEHLRPYGKRLRTAL